MAYSYKYIFITGKISKYKSALQDITDFCHEPRRAGVFFISETQDKQKLWKDYCQVLNKFFNSSFIKEKKSYFISYIK